MTHRRIGKVLLAVAVAGMTWATTSDATARLFGGRYNRGHGCCYQGTSYGCGGGWNNGYSSGCCGSYGVQHHAYSQPASDCGCSGSGTVNYGPTPAGASQEQWDNSPPPPPQQPGSGNMEQSDNVRATSTQNYQSGPSSNDFAEGRSAGVSPRDKQSAIDASSVPFDTGNGS